MIIKLDFPAPELFPNKKHGKSWVATYANKEREKEAAFYFTKQAIGDWKDPGGYIPMSIVFSTPTRHRRDLDNMLSAFKSAQDGIASALGIDDHRFKPVLVDWVYGVKPGCVVVAVGVQIVSSMSIE